MPTPKIFQSSTAKLIGIGFLVLLMNVPLSMVDGLRRERESRRSDAEYSIASSWGAGTRLTGPVLAVPQKYMVRTELPKEKWVLEEKWTWWYLLPETVNAEAELDISKRHKGIFELPVYQANVRLEGSFAPAAGDIHIKQGELLWEQARLLLPIADPRGLRELLSNIDGRQDQRFTPSSQTLAGMPVFEVALPPLDANKPLPFSFDMKFAGSETLDFLPMARTFSGHVKAPWPDPSFFGAFAPAFDASAKPGAFSASWQVLEFNRSFPSVWADNDIQVDALNSAAFGVKLYRSADVYQQNERTTKYGFLFIALTFGVFFLIEVLKQIRVHPVQYLLIGAALATFYLVLLAASEHMNFALAYVLGAGALVTIITGYCITILRSLTRGLSMGLWFSMLYAVLYVLITRENTSLLMGAGIVLLLIAAAMFFTRRIDWYNLGSNNAHRTDTGLDR